MVHIVLTCRLSSADCRHDLRLYHGLVERTDVFGNDDPLAVDDIGFRHARETPIDADTAVGVEAEAVVGVAELAQEVARWGWLVLVDEAVDSNAPRGTACTTTPTR